MFLPRTAFLLTLVVAGVACRKKFEVLPEGAKQITRSDTNEAGENGAVALREYRFALADAKGVTHAFACETRSYPDVESAKKAAKKSIAERPQSGEEKALARFAASGRSVWLWHGRELVWCMLTTPRVADVATAMQPVIEIFKKQFEGSS